MMSLRLEILMMVMIRQWFSELKHCGGANVSKKNPPYVFAFYLTIPSISKTKTK